MKIKSVYSLFFCVLISTGAYAGVFDDIYFWWHLDYDGNNDGIAQLDEIRDQRHWGIPGEKGVDGRHAYSIGTPDALEWIEDVPNISGGLPYGNMAIVFEPHTNITTTVVTNNSVVTTNVVRNCWPETIKVNASAVKSNCTVMCRFRFDGLAMNEWPNPSWIVNNGLSWTEQLGWMFGVRRRDNKFYLSMLVAKEEQYYLDVPLEIGKWYEAAAVLRDNGTDDTVTFYLWPEDTWEDFMDQDMKSGLTWKTYNSSSVTNELKNYDIRIGGEVMIWNWGSNANVTKSFRGALNYLALWDRDLSHNEVLEAFGYHSPLLTIGCNDNNIKELTDESYTDSLYDIGDPWHTMPRAVTHTNPDLVIRAHLTEMQAQQNYVMHLNTHAGQGGQSADLALIVNQNTNQIFTVNNAENVFWDIPAEHLISGTNTFTISYVAGPSNWMSWDWLEIFGSWQVGYDNNNANEFVREQNWAPDYFLSDPDWTHCRRAVTTLANVHLNFTLSAEMLERHIFTYTSEVMMQGPTAPGSTPEPPHKLQLEINDNIVVTDLEVLDNTTVVFDDIKQYLVPGNNSIVWKNIDVGGWAHFDYHRLEMALPPGPPKGSLLIIR